MIKSENYWTHIEYGAGNGGFQQWGSPEQYDILYDTVHGLVKEKGNRGTFFINDIIEGWARYAAHNLSIYVADKGRFGICIKVLPGDYIDMELIRTDSAHLKYPSPSMFSRERNPEIYLQELANHSEEGLELTLTPDSMAIIEELQKRSLLTFTDRGEGFQYNYPNVSVVCVPSPIESRRLLILPNNREV